MKFEYIKVSYRQETGGQYRFYENFKDEGFTVDDASDIIPVLNYYGESGWEFINWDKGKLILKRRK